MDVWGAASSVERELCHGRFLVAMSGGVKIFCLALDFKKSVFIFQIREGKQNMKP